jgi:hypothetical protein
MKLLQKVGNKYRRCNTDAWGRDGSVGIAIRWTDRGSIPGGGEIFCTRPDRPWGPPSLLYNRYRVFPGGKAAGAWWLSSSLLAPRPRESTTITPPPRISSLFGVPLPLTYLRVRGKSTAVSR